MRGVSLHIEHCLSQISYSSRFSHPVLFKNVYFEYLRPLIGPFQLLSFPNVVRRVNQEGLLNASARDHAAVVLLVRIHFFVQRGDLKSVLRYRL